MDKDHYMSPFIDLIPMEQGMDWAIVYIAPSRRPALDLDQPQSFSRTKVDRQLGFARCLWGKGLAKQKGHSDS
jgi:hypothetical protein